MKKQKILYVSMFYIISLFYLSLQGEAAILKLIIKSPSANIRLKPNTSALVISTAPLGAMLVSKEKAGDWYKVDLPPDNNGVILVGYVHQSLVDIIEEIFITNDEEKSGPSLKYSLRASVPNASIRLKPTTEAAAIFLCPIGALLYSEMKIGDWYKINLPPDKDGIIIYGFIQEKEVEVIEEAKETPETKLLMKEKPQNVLKTQEETPPLPPFFERPASFRTGFSLAFATGDWATLFGAGLGINGSISVALFQKPTVDILGNMEGIIFMSTAGYTDFHWSRIIGAIDLRLSILAGKILFFTQGGAGIYFDILNIENWLYYASGSELDIGARIGGGLSIGKFEIMATFHIVDRNMFAIVGTYKFN